jgi:4-methylaminobutanoate oxidase (formaldehyde-forming)
VNYFLPDGEEATRSMAAEHTVDKAPNWLAHVRAEHLHTRAAVSLFDLTSFAKLHVAGPAAEEVLQRLCCADISKADACVYTGMLNERGGYESDCTVTKLRDELFMVVSPTAQATRDADWIRRGIEDNLKQGGGAAVVTDVTGSMAVLAVMGPLSRALLQRLTHESLSDEVRDTPAAL